MASLVTMTAFLTACSSSEDSVTGADNERGMVKAEFTISFPQSTTGLTRLSADVVQVAASSNITKFRGIKDIRLFPFLDVPANVDENAAVPTAITLYGTTAAGGEEGPSGASGAANNTISGSSTLYSGSQAHLYKNVDIAIGTKSFIFYGEAAGTASAQMQGGLLKSTGSTLGDIIFSPQPIFQDTEVGSNGEAIAAYLTSIANTEDADGNKWSDTTNPGLAALYANFTSITTGAWANVKAAMQRVYTNLAPGGSDVATTTAMKTAIREAIVNDAYGVSENAGKLSFSEDYGNYPADLNLPDGAAYIVWNKTAKKFETTVDAEKNTGMNVAPLSRFVYPASLYYWVKSGIKTSETTKDSYSDTETWTNITGGYTDGTAVTSKTRSIVITDPVQYAVARLDLTLQATTSLKDAANKVITLTSGTTNHFPVTGIIIGGQKPVDYKFEQIASGTSYTMYDSQVADNGSRYLNTTKSSAIHTLVLESNDATSADDTGADVQIAVELQNNGSQTIVGANGQYIFPGCKFYLIGTLHPWKTGETNPTYKRAFTQDVTTTANLVVNSLANAHCTLPDLGVPQLDLGVSIDLTWKTGESYDIPIN